MVDCQGIILVEQEIGELPMEDTRSFEYAFPFYKHYKDCQNLISSCLVHIYTIIFIALILLFFHC